MSKAMRITRAAIPDVLIIEPPVFRDERGFFLESWNAKEFSSAVGVVHFVQDNQSRSSRGVLRGLHYQVQQPQAKLVRVVRGRVLDVAVDLRRSSSTFGQWVSTELSGDDNKQCWIPIGFAHGLLVLSDSADVLYKVTDYYAPQHERCLIWNDPAIDIAWPLDVEPTVSVKDKGGVLLRDAEVFP